MRVVDGTGHELVLSPTDATTKDMFWATVGGMGLTGVIVEATFRLLAIETSSMSVDTVRCHDLDDVMARMIEGDDDYRYSVAWIDSVAPSGRGVLTRGDHARREQLTRKQERMHTSRVRDTGLAKRSCFHPERPVELCVRACVQ